MKTNISFTSNKVLNRFKTTFTIYRCILVRQSHHLPFDKCLVSEIREVIVALNVGQYLFILLPYYSVHGGQEMSNILQLNFAHPCQTCKKRRWHKSDWPNRNASS